MIVIENERTTNIEGIEAVTIQQFARLTHRSVTTIRRLIDSGNQYRRLQVLHVMGKPLIPISELKNYPFTLQGRDQRQAFHLSLNPKTNELELVDAEGYCVSDEYLFCDNLCHTCKYYKRIKDDRISLEDDTVRTSTGSVQ